MLVGGLCTTNFALKTRCSTLAYVLMVLLVSHIGVFKTGFGTSIDLHNPIHGLVYWWLVRFFFVGGVSQGYFKIAGLADDNGGDGGGVSSLECVSAVAQAKMQTVKLPLLRETRSKCPRYNRYCSKYIYSPRLTALVSMTTSQMVRRWKPSTTRTVEHPASSQHGCLNVFVYGPTALLVCCFVCNNKLNRSKGSS